MDMIRCFVVACGRQELRISGIDSMDEISIPIWLDEQTDRTDWTKKNDYRLLFFQISRLMRVSKCRCCSSNSQLMFLSPKENFPGRVVKNLSFWLSSALYICHLLGRSSHIMSMLPMGSFSIRSGLDFYVFTASPMEEENQPLVDVWEPNFCWLISLSRCRAISLQWH